MADGPRVIGVGSPLMDLLAHVSEEFLRTVPGDKGGMQLVEHEHIDSLMSAHEGEVIYHCGGGAANAIYGLAKLGMSTAFIGKLGRDALGESFIEQFADAGVDVSTFRYGEGDLTGRCLSMITPDAERTMRTNLGAATFLHPDEITTADFTGFDVMHTESYLLFNPPLAKKVLESAKEAGCRVSLGLSSFEVVRANRAELAAVLSEFVDYVFANEEEALSFSDGGDVLAALEVLAEHCHVAAVTRGADGALIAKGEERVEVAAEAAKPIDGTGAGDLWSAGFLYGDLMGMGAQRAAKLAGVLGARVVERHGARLPQELWDKVKQDLKLGEAKA